MSTQVEAIFSRKDKFCQVDAQLALLRRLDSELPWELDNGVSGPFLSNGNECLMLLPQTQIFSSTLSWVGFLADPISRSTFFSQLRKVAEALSAESFIVYPNSGYKMEIIANLAIEEAMSIQEIREVLESQYKDQKLLLSNLVQNRYSRDEATDVDVYLEIDISYLRTCF